MNKTHTHGRFAPILLTQLPLLFACGAGEVEGTAPLEDAVEQTIVDLRVGEEGLLQVHEDVFKAHVDARLAAVEEVLAPLAEADHLRDQIAAERRRIEELLAAAPAQAPEDEEQRRLEISRGLGLIEARLAEAGHSVESQEAQQ